jgi:GNAT superfamily N-acetyltransferase
MVEVTVWYLEQDTPVQPRAAAGSDDLRVEEVRIKQYQFNRFMYELVGAPWQWTDKLRWSDQKWREYAERDRLRTWAAWLEGAPAGYFELEKRPDNSVDLAYFGLAERFIGRGLGAGFLTRALVEAWQWGATRVTVNTCSLDHPAALENYRRRGFRLVRTEVKRG